MPSPKIALSTHFFGNRPLERVFFELIADSGIGAIELWMMDPQLDVRDPRDILRIGQWLEAAQVECASLHAPFWVDLGKPEFRWLSLASPDPGIRDVTIDLTRNAIEAAAALGADIVVVHGIGESSKDSLDVAEGRFWDSMAKLAPSAERLGVRLAVENVITPYSRVHVIHRFVERFGNQQVGICVDIGHAFIEGDPQKALDAAVPYLFEVHIADNMGTEDDHLLPYEGKIDWEPIWLRLKDSSDLKVATFEVMPICISGDYTMPDLKKRLEKVAAGIEDVRERMNG